MSAETIERIYCLAAQNDIEGLCREAVRNARAVSQLVNLVRNLEQRLNQAERDLEITHASKRATA